MITVRPVDPLDPADDARFAAWHAVVVAADVHELGERRATWSAEELRVRAREATDRAFTVLAAEDDGTVVGAAELALPLHDNLGAAYGELRVHPDHRRRGVGSALLTALEATAVAAGRTVLDVEQDRSLALPDATTPFAARHGYTAAQDLAHNDLDLPPDGDLEALLAPVEAEAGSPAGYRLETWWDEVPEQWLDQQAVLSARMSTDAPNGGTALEPTVWDADRVREGVALARAQGRRALEVVAVHEATATLAGYTRLLVSAASPHVAYQDDTLVLREHRGHRLGMALKARATRELLSALPGVRRVTTWNAEDNVPMLRVNHALGFRRVAVMTIWEKRGLRG